MESRSACRRCSAARRLMRCDFMALAIEARVGILPLLIFLSLALFPWTRIKITDQSSVRDCIPPLHSPVIYQVGHVEISSLAGLISLACARTLCRCTYLKQVPYDRVPGISPPGFVAPIFFFATSFLIPCFAEFVVRIKAITHVHRLEYDSLRKPLLPTLLLTSRPQIDGVPQRPV